MLHCIDGYCPPCHKAGTIIVEEEGICIMCYMKKEEALNAPIIERWEQEQKKWDNGPERKEV